MRALVLFLVIVGQCLVGMLPAFAEGQVVVSKRTIYPGQPIERSDLKIVELIRPVQVRYRVVRQMDEIVGLVAARTILAGRYIPANAGRPASIIKAGEPAKVLFKSGTLAISTTAVPLSDAAIGDRVRLRNPSSGKTYHGIVLRDGTVLAGAV